MSTLLCQMLYDQMYGITLRKGKTTICSTQAYNTITAHFISPNLELNTFLVQMMSFPENHNVENIYVTGFGKTVLNRTFCISRNINLKY